MPVLLGISPASAGSQTTTNACLSNATATYSDLDWTLTGNGAPDPITLGSGDITLSGSTIQVNIPATLLVAGYNLGLLNLGSNNIPTIVYVARQATNVDIGGAVSGTKVQVDNFNITATTTITDTDGVPGTGDEGATPLAVNEPLPDMVVTPMGGNVAFSQGPNGSLPLLAPGVAGTGSVQPNGSIFASASVAGGLIRANFDCFPGNADIVPPATSAATFTPASSVTPFETVAVNAPPTAPVCVNESTSVGVTQSTVINLNNNCTDVNEDQGGGSPFTFTVDDSLLAGTLVEDSPGVYTYTAPAADPGAPDVFTFTATDTTTLVSNTAEVSITILANQCDATADDCSLTEIIVQPVVGTTMTLDKTPGLVIMSPVVLNGDAQVSTGALQELTVTNARGSAAGWSLSAYTTDLGAPGGPTIDLTPLGRPGVVIPACSARGGANILVPADPAGFDRLCIPGDNLGWEPSASIAHDIIHGDVADVDAGPAHATDAADWRTQLTAANSNLLTENGLGGLTEVNVLCSAADEVSGGTFDCNADLFLGVPASAGAGTYTGGIVLTLL